MVLSISKQERTWKKNGMLRIQADGQGRQYITCKHVVSGTDRPPRLVVFMGEGRLCMHIFSKQLLEHVSYKA